MVKKNKIVALDLVTNEINGNFEILEQKIGELPTRDEFFKAMDKLMAEIKAERDENDDIDLRFKTIERHFPQVV